MGKTEHSLGMMEYRKDATSCDNECTSVSIEPQQIGEGFLEEKVYQDAQGKIERLASAIYT